MRLLQLLWAGVLRPWVTLASFLGNFGSAHRSDYWGGEDQPVDSGEMHRTSRRRRRQRRKNYKDADTQD